MPHKHKVVIAGNHDLSFHFQPHLTTGILTNANYLQDSSVNIEGVNFHGSPWTPKFGFGWAFNAEEEDMKDIAESMPREIDVLITHGPPHGIGDLCLSGDRAGCPSLLDAAKDRQPLLYVFGHIHEGRGCAKICDTFYVNATNVDFNYRLVHDPVIFDLFK